MVHVSLGILATHGDFAHVRHIEYSAVVAHSLVFFHNAGILYGHVKAAERSYQGSQLHMPVVKAGSFVFHICRFSLLLNTIVKRQKGVAWLILQRLGAEQQADEVVSAQVHHHFIKPFGQDLL